MSEPTCDACHRPVTDAARICQVCTDRLARTLNAIPGLVEELMTTRTRQSRTGNSSVGYVKGGHDQPLPWDERATETMSVLRSTLVGWTRDALDAVVLHDGPTCTRCPHPSCAAVRNQQPPADTISDIARWLLGRLDWLRRSEDAAQADDEIRAAVALAQATIDLPPERTYAGPCRVTLEATQATDDDDEHGPACCVAELHARTGKRTVTCRACHTAHDVTDRRAWLLEVARGQLATIRELSTLLSPDGRPVPERTIRSWVARGRLVERGQDRRGHATYSVGEAADLHADTRAQRSA